MPDPPYDALPIPGPGPVPDSAAIPRPPPPAANGNGNGNSTPREVTTTAQLAALLADSYRENDSLRDQLALTSKRAEKAERTLSILQQSISSSSSSSPDAINVAVALPEAAAKAVMECEERAHRAENARDEMEARMRAFLDGWCAVDKYLQVVELRSGDARLAFSRFLSDGAPLTAALQPESLPPPPFPRHRQPSRGALAPPPSASRVRPRTDSDNALYPPSKKRCPDPQPFRSSLSSATFRMDVDPPYHDPPPHPPPHQHHVRSSRSRSSSTSSLSIDEMLLQATDERAGASSEISPSIVKNHSNGRATPAPAQRPSPRTASEYSSQYIPPNPYPHRRYTPASDPSPDSFRRQSPAQTQRNGYPPPPPEDLGGQMSSYQTTVFAPVVTGAPIKKPKYPSSGSTLGGGGSNTSNGDIQPHSDPSPSSSGTIAPHNTPGDRTIHGTPMHLRFPPTNDQGQRICRQCGMVGRYKEGKCVEKWGPGPMGPGTVCDRCRKKMKRIERRGTLESQQQLQQQQQQQQQNQNHGVGPAVARSTSMPGVQYPQPNVPPPPPPSRGIQRSDTIPITLPPPPSTHSIHQQSTQIISSSSKSSPQYNIGQQRISDSQPTAVGYGGTAERDRDRDHRDSDHPSAPDLNTRVNSSSASPAPRDRDRDQPRLISQSKLSTSTPPPPPYPTAARRRRRSWSPVVVESDAYADVDGVQQEPEEEEDELDADADADEGENDVGRGGVGEAVLKVREMRDRDREKEVDDALLEAVEAAEAGTGDAGGGEKRMGDGPDRDVEWSPV